MKKTALAVALIGCMLVGTAFAGGSPQTSIGTKQLVFQFHGLSHLGLSSYGFSSMREVIYFASYELDEDLEDLPLYGGGIGIRYFFGEGLAIRPSINISYASAKADYEGSGTDPKSTATDIAFSALLEKHLPAVHSISPYLGAGLGYDRFKIEDEPYYDWDKASITLSALDLKGVVGFQWYFTDGMSLGGEYLGSFSMGKVTTESTDGGETEKGPELTFNRFYWDAASVFLSVTF